MESVWRAVGVVAAPMGGALTGPVIFTRLVPGGKPAVSSAATIVSSTAPMAIHAVAVCMPEGARGVKAVTPRMKAPPARVCDEVRVKVALASPMLTGVRPSK